MFLLWFLPMASVWRHPKSQFWTACFTDGDGRRRKRSTKEANRKKAQKIADEWEKAARVQRTALQSRRVIEQLHAELTEEQITVPAVGHFVEAWLSRKRNEVKASTFAFYKSSLNQFVEFLGDAAREGVDRIHKQQVIDYRDSLASRLAPKTANHHLKSLRMLFRSAKEDGHVADDPTEFVKAVSGAGSKGKRPFTMEELSTLLHHCDEEWASMVIFGLYTGQRLADLARLDWGKLDLEKEVIRMTTGKTGRHMLIPIAAPLLDHIATLPASDRPTNPIHPRAFAVIERQGKAGGLSNQFKDILARAGLAEKTSHRKKGVGRSGKRDSSDLSFHSLRSTAATLLHEAGIPEAVAEEMIGHRSSDVHRLYVRVGEEAMRKAAAVLPSIKKS